MKSKLILIAALSILSTTAFAQTPSWGPVDTRGLMYPPSPSAQAMADHKLYVQNLVDAGFKPNDTSNWGAVNLTPLMAPNHSKVPNGPKDPGCTARTAIGVCY